MAIFAKERTALKDWYMDAFELRVVHDNNNDTYFLMAPDGVMFELKQFGKGVGTQRDKADTSQNVTVAVNDFEDMVDRLMAATVEVVSEDDIYRAETKTFFFKDGEGNIYQLIGK